MTLAQDDLDYFRLGKGENPKFFSRLGGLPDLEGKKVLDVGCGHGSLCIYMAEHGAARVVGVDIESCRTEFAREYFETDYSHLAGKCEFRCCDIADLDERDFDIIVSKDSFEHIIDLAGCLREISERLAPGGRLYTGFGPLYYSPFGDHRRTGARVPWGHLVIPEHILFRRLNKMRETPVESVCDLGLNKLKLRDYLRLFKESGLEVEYCGVNVSRNVVSRLFTLISRIPPLREYLSHNMYCILKRPQ